MHRRLVYIVIIFVLFGSCHEPKDITDPKNWRFETFAGSTEGFQDGPLKDAKFDDPIQMALAPNGDIYVTDNKNGRIRKISNGMVTTVAGLGGTAYEMLSGPVETTRLRSPLGIVVTNAGVVYFSDESVIRKLENNYLTIVADNENAEVMGMTLGHDNAIYYADYRRNRIVRMSLDNVNLLRYNLKKFCGAADGEPGLKDSSGSTDARFRGPTDIAKGPAYTYYVADNGNGRVRTVDYGGAVTTINVVVPICQSVTPLGSDGIFVIAGPDFSEIKDGILTRYLAIPADPDDHFFSGPEDVLAAPDGSILICDTGHNRIVRAIFD